MSHKGHRAMLELHTHVTSISESFGKAAMTKNGFLNEGINKLQIKIMRK